MSQGSSQPQSPIIAVIGATGRVGRAIGRLGDGVHLIGCARHEPTGEESASDLGYEQMHVLSRLDRSRLTEFIAPASAVIDLCAFGAQDIESLNASVDVGGPRHLVIASSLAERPLESWADEEHETWDDEPISGGEYGQGKRLVRQIAERYWLEAGRSVTTVLLPQIVAPDDAHAAELAYLREARSSGMVTLSGSGEQRPCVATTAQAAAALLGLALSTEASESVARYQLAPRASPKLSELVEALLQGAQVKARLQGGRSGRGPHSGASEVVDAARLRARIPQLDWSQSSVLRAYVELGQRLSDID
ncbi:MAG: hypothetical protein CMH53_09920 [Myxococcales bacterium]|nr:hypothetical protein [Myxococcales bacterium]